MAFNCPTCGAENPDSAEFCNLCLVPLDIGADEYTTTAPDGEGYLEHYPSSFDEGAPSGGEVAAAGEAQEAPPVDIGEYGVRTGQSVEESPGAAGRAVEVPPVQVWPQEPVEEFQAPFDSSYQQQAGQQPGYRQPEYPYQQTLEDGRYLQQTYPATETQPPGEAWQQGYSGAYGTAAAGARPFDWTRALLLCTGAAAIAALMSIGLELFFSFIGYSVAMSTNISVGLVLVFMSLLIPVAFASFSCGYKLERYGWALGLISVGLWAFVFRPLYYAILSWMLTDRFSFSAVFSKASLAFIFGLFLPLGALIGWLGEKRATTGLFF